MSGAHPAAGGAVYDRGYRPYEGKLGGRRAATAALYRTSLRRAIGIRRPWRQKMAPALLLAIAIVPAVVNVGVGYLTRDSPAEGFEFITYREYVGVSSALLLFVALVAPDIVCPDRRQRVLPLIFARPLTGRDYALAKIGAIFTCVFAFSFIPQVVLYIGQMLVSDGALDYLTSHTAVLWQVPVAVALLALFYAVLGVAVASLTGRRMVAGATMLGITLVTSAVSGIIVETSNGGPRSGPGQGHIAGLIDILALPLYVRDLVFLGHQSRQSTLSGVAGGSALAVLCYSAVVIAGIAVVLVRYRSAET
ncbi:MAG: type transport system permease protein [Actinomycetota bacterium]|jgi:ABC-2 type transport system permease protein|nr:type transport system permease protein [Actinomycetota bacterium]